VAKVHGSSIKDDKKYEGLRKKGMSTERAAKIANTPNASSEGSKSSSRSSSSSSSGRSTSQRKAAAGRKGGRKSH
jgi:hypothetical protein